MKTLTLLLMAAAPSIASANVMTFDNVVETGLRQVYVEDGITTSVKRVAESTTGDQSVHLDASGPGDPSMDFTMDGTFIAESVLIHPDGSGYCATVCGSDENGIVWDAIPYIWFSGFLEDTLVGSLGVSRPVGDWELFTLDFLGTIDLLRIEVRSSRQLGLGFCNLGAGCGHFNVDNVTLTSVPEPETLVLMLAGLAPLLLRRRRGAR